jgi:DeoR/GlpR family transcriptional regulator of sugar metabolism
MTIHRDLNILISMGSIFKIKNHYCTKEFIAKNYDITSKTSHFKEKTKIAQKVNQHLKSGAILFVSPGTTSEILVKHIKTTCTIYTNSLKVYLSCKNNSKIKPILIGGFDEKDKEIFTGSQTIVAIKNIFFDIAILSVAAISSGGWLCNTTEEEALIEGVAADSADKVFVIADLSKFENKKSYRFLNLNKVDLLFTNKEVKKEIKTKTIVC